MRNPSKNLDRPAANRDPTRSAQMIAPTIPPPDAISHRVPSVATTESRHVNWLCLTNFQQDSSSDMDRLLSGFLTLTQVTRIACVDTRRVAMLGRTSCAAVGFD